MMRNERGFTLIEIIAVLVILGILAAVAVPRYLNLQEQARINAAQSAIAELKGRASNIYAMKTLRAQSAPACNDVATSLAESYDSTHTPLQDFTVSSGASCSGGTPNSLSLSVSAVKGVSITPVTGSWFFPSFE